ncbi:HipA domain-containing protein [Mesorhizobium sp. M00.F.Ca.ET.216.01.1.1]|uniref:type II toxin-antitoxin system HipA family toxin n=1 Tax=Mesorhizobium sp. M00.F.Ca.ET.216.01.1.1 TaxID=2500528 RepID=UPI000FDB8D03|nr:HipA domain-containing protein [Mesorhizobium sp. M00.F.Ca.ET.216.01.1.1]TGQ35772.1 type II toxin-antitoxin system HipA family toxin [Mesorhizobium sp. M00.F.Ca.ET.216.01.1.1]
MMDQETLVYADLDGTSHLVGRLWAHMRKNRESATFEYAPSWLENRERFALELALQLGEGAFHTTADRFMFGSIGDSAPDHWGRALMRRAERRRAERAGEAPNTLREIDYLLAVDDEARPGALRFATKEGGPFLAHHEDTTRIPPLIELPRLLAATERIIDDDDDEDEDEDLRLLLAPGSSLGGARPKASVRDRDGALIIAKFAHKDDEFNTVAWEAVALSLAARAGIATATSQFEHIAEKPVLLLRRFDRDGATRIPFLSAMSMLGAKDNETHSYLEIVDALRQSGARPKEDMHELWRRIVFTIMISNSDDHMRNHGFLYTGPDGWILSPAYDLNPVPVDIKPRVLSTAIDLDDQTASLDVALSVADYFELKPAQAEGIAAEVAASVSGWRNEAARIGLSARDCNRMASAFEHHDLAAALKNSRRLA